MGAVGQWDPELFERFRGAVWKKRRRRLLAELVRTQTPLIVHLAGQVRRDRRAGGAHLLSWDDILSAAHVAFARTMRDYDPQRGGLARLLRWRILDEVQRATQEASVVMRARRKRPPPVEYLESDDELVAELPEREGIRDAIAVFLEQHCAFASSARVAAYEVRERFESAIVSHLAANVNPTDPDRYASLVAAREALTPRGALTRTLLASGAERVMIRVPWAPSPVRGFAGMRLQDRDGVASAWGGSK